MMLKANVEYPGSIIRYTTDGSEPITTSQQYVKPVKADGKVLPKCFDASGKSSRTIQLID